MKAFPIASNLCIEGDEKGNITIFFLLKSNFKIIASTVRRTIGNNDVNDSVEILIVCSIIQVPFFVIKF